MTRWPLSRLSTPGRACARIMLTCLLLAAAAVAKADIPELALTAAESQLLGNSLVHVVDSSASLNASDIAGGRVQPDWQPASGETPNLGLVREPVWFAAWLESPRDLERLLVIAYPPLDHLDLSLWHQGQLVQRFATGDRLPFDSRPIEHRDFVFPLQFKAGERYLLLLRVETTGSVQLPASLWEPSRYVEETQHGLLLQALFIGIMLALAAYHLLLYFAVRDVAYLWYVVFLGTFLMAQVSLRGLGLQYLWPDNPAFNHQAIPLFFSVGFAVVCIFTDRFLDAKRYSPGWSRALRGLAGIGAAIALCGLVLPYSAILIAILAGSTLGSVLIFIGSCHLWARGSTLAPIFVLAWSLFLAGNILFNLSKLGVLPSSTFTEYLPQVGTVLQMLLLSFALAYRINLERARREEAQQRNLAMQREANEVLESRVAERTEALELAYDQLKVLSQLDSLTQLKNRAYFDEVLAKEWSRHARESRSLALLLIDADHFKRINDTRGHLCGDECLRVIAALCQEQVQRSSDLVCRYGGEELVVLLPGTDTEGALAVAEAIRQAIAGANFQWQGEAVPLTASIGVAACVPNPDLAADALLRQADEALYAAKGAGRNCTMVYNANP